MSNIRTNLPNPYQEVQRRHPLIRAQSRLACKIVKMRDQPLHHVGESRIWGLRVDDNGILGDIINIQVLHGRRRDLFGRHLVMVDVG